MKRICLLNCFFALALLLHSCNSHPRGPGMPSGETGADKKKSTGKIEFRQELHNFGTVKEGEIVAFTFLFRNTGNGPVRLNKVEAGCGCLTMKYDQGEIPAGGSSEIEVRFNAAGEWGNQVKTIDVATSSGQSIQLTIGAFVENKNFNFDLNN